MKEDLAKLKCEKENAQKKLTSEKSASMKVEDNLKRIAANLRSAELEISGLNRQLHSERKTIERLNREKDTAVKNATTLEDMNKQLSLELRVLEQTNRKMEETLEEMTEGSNELRRQIKSLENERDRCTLESKELAMQVVGDR